MEAAQMSAITALCSSWVPWEKFRRQTLTPAIRSSSIIFGEVDAGPMVATIFVLRMEGNIPD